MCVCVCARSHAGQRPRRPAGADGRHGHLCLQTAEPAVSLPGETWRRDTCTPATAEELTDPGTGATS